MDERSHSLIYYKSENTSEKAQGSIDLLLIADIVPYDKNKDSDRASTTAPTSTDLARFNIDMGDGGKVFKFKASSPVEAQRWMDELNEWKSYCLMNMSV